MSVVDTQIKCSSSRVASGLQSSLLRLQCHGQTSTVTYRLLNEPSCFSIEPTIEARSRGIRDAKKSCNLSCRDLREILGARPTFRADLKRRLIHSDVKIYKTCESPTAPCISMHQGNQDIELGPERSCRVVYDLDRTYKGKLVRKLA